MTAAVGQEVVRQLLLLCYYNYLIRRAVNIMSVLLKRHASKLIHLEAQYHQSLLHSSHTHYQAPAHEDTVELLLWDTPIQGTLPFKRQKFVTIKTRPYSRERDTFSGSQNPVLSSIQGTPSLLKGTYVTDHKKG